MKAQPAYATDGSVGLNMILGLMMMAGDLPDAEEDAGPDRESAASPAGDAALIE